MPVLSWANGFGSYAECCVISQAGTATNCFRPCLKQVKNSRVCCGACLIGTSSQAVIEVPITEVNLQGLGVAAQQGCRSLEAHIIYVCTCLSHGLFRIVFLRKIICLPVIAFLQKEFWVASIPERRCAICTWLSFVFSVLRHITRPHVEFGNSLGYSVHIASAPHLCRMLWSLMLYVAPWGFRICETPTCVLDFTWPMSLSYTEWCARMYLFWVCLHMVLQAYMLSSRSRAYMLSSRSVISALTACDALSLVGTLVTLLIYHGSERHPHFIYLWICVFLAVFYDVDTCFLYWGMLQTSLCILCWYS